jgi:hypothetical protein
VVSQFWAKLERHPKQQENAMARKYEYQIIKLTGEPLNARLGCIREALGLIAAKYDGKPVGAIAES